MTSELKGKFKDMALNINQHHQSVIFSYMKFAKYMRSQNLKQIQQPFQDIESRLFDDTYTKEEVKALIGDLEKIVLCDVESELINFAHNNVLMLKQMFKQAEKWYLRLEIDISELQNQEELEEIKLLESDETQSSTAPKPETREHPEDFSVPLLKMEIERLKEENERLSKMVQNAEDNAELYNEEKNRLGEKLLRAQKEIGNYKMLVENRSGPKNDGEEAIKEMEAKLNEIQKVLSINIENLEENENIKDKLRTELMSTKEKVKQVEAQLQLAEANSKSAVTNRDTVSFEYFMHFLSALGWKLPLSRGLKTTGKSPPKSGLPSSLYEEEKANENGRLLTK